MHFKSKLIFQKKIVISHRNSPKNIAKNVLIVLVLHKVFLLLKLCFPSFFFILQISTVQLLCLLSEALWVKFNK